MKSWEIDVMMLRSELIFRKYAERTQDIYIKTVEDFLMMTDKESCHIQREDVIRYLDRRLKEDSKNTVLVKLNALEFFFEEVLALDITEHIKKYTREHKGELLSMQEIDILLGSVPLRDKMILNVLLETGKYPKEVVTWKVSDLSSKEDGWYLAGNKIKKEIVGELLKYIEKFEITEYLFPGKQEKLAASSIHHMIRRQTTAFLGRVVSLSELRHTVAFELWRQGKKKEMHEYLGRDLKFANIKQWYKFRGIILERIG